MELAQSDEQSYLLELHAYQTAFFDFKYEHPSFVSVEIKTSNKVLATPSVVQPIAITKLVSPLRGGTCIEIKPLPVKTFTIHFIITILVSELVVNSKRYDKE
jgi:hypothetical protein